MEEVKLLGAWASSFTYRVIWALELKGVKYRYVEQDLFNKIDLLLLSNPVYKKVPVLIHGGRSIAESLVILEYIEHCWPEHPLFPTDPYQRATARSWIKFAEDSSPAFFKFFQTIGEEQEQAMKEAREVLKILEDNGLGDSKFFSGDEIGMVDIAVGWIACWLDVLEEAACIKLLEADSLPRLQKWAENFKEVEVIREHIPDRDKLLVYYRSRREMFIKAAAT